MATWTPIPGETPIDPSGLKVHGVTTRRQLNALEFANITKAITKHLGRKPTRRSARFDVAWTRRLHKDMFGDVWTWAGRFRQADTNIGVSWHTIEVELTECLSDLLFRERYGDFPDQAVWLHHRTVRIHPFPNGNGRWSRLLANIWLLMHEQPVTLWPDTIGEVSPIRENYIAAMVSADGGDLGPLTALHKRFAQSVTGQSAA